MKKVGQDREVLAFQGPWALLGQVASIHIGALVRNEEWASSTRLECLGGDGGYSFLISRTYAVPLFKNTS